MTQLFYYLDFEIHDIEYWKLSFITDEVEREKQRKQADFWLLKYSWIGPLRVIQKFSLSWIIIKDILNILLTLILLTANIIVMPIALLGYIAVRFWGKRAININ